jgi:regulator of nonsense transcripts 2
VVDNVLEAIRIGMEINQPHYNQRRVAEAKLLGELYNYRMVESNIIFNTLYLVISFGSLPDGMFFDRGSFSRLSVAMSFKCNFH